MEKVWHQHVNKYTESPDTSHLGREEIAQVLWKEHQEHLVAVVLQARRNSLFSCLLILFIRRWGMLLS